MEMVYPEIKMNLGKRVVFQDNDYILLGYRTISDKDNPWVPVRFELVLYDKARNCARFVPMEEVKAEEKKLFGWRSAEQDAKEYLQEELI